MRKPMHPDNYNTDAELASHLLCDTECSVCAKAAMRLKELSKEKANMRPLNKLGVLEDLTHATAAEYQTYHDQMLVRDDDALEMTLDYVPEETYKDAESGPETFNHYGFAMKVSRETEIRVLNRLRALGMLVESGTQVEDIGGLPG